MEFSVVSVNEEDYSPEGNVNALELQEYYIKTLVIFIDEATSALDQESETEIFKCLEVLHDKTIVYITHQLSTISKCDKIIVLDDGEVIGVGRYDELIKTNLKFDDDQQLNAKSYPVHPCDFRWWFF